MRWFSFILILLAATLLEAGNWLDLIPISGWMIGPSVLITLLVYYSLSCRPNKAISFCFVIGIAADLAAGSMGPHMLCYGLLGSVLSSTGRMVTIKHPLQQALLVMIAYLVTEIGAYWFSLLKVHEPKPDVYAFCLLTALFSAVLCPLVWSIASTLSAWSGLEKQSGNRTY